MYVRTIRSLGISGIESATGTGFPEIRETKLDP